MIKNEIVKCPECGSINISKGNIYYNCEVCETSFKKLQSKPTEESMNEKECPKCNKCGSLDTELMDSGIVFMCKGCDKRFIPTSDQFLNIKCPECKGEVIHRGGDHYDCPNCSLNITQIESKQKPSKPPLGLKPRGDYEDRRLSDIMNAINRYFDARKVIPLIWLKEYNDKIESKDGV